MKFQFSLFTSLFALSSIVYAQDGASGDGNCDPCDENCAIFSKRDLSNIPRMLEWNDSSPFDPEEGVRWRKPAPPGTVVSGRFAKRAPMYMLEFDANKLPEICNNICYGLYCAGKGLSQTLTINRANCRAARKSNACGSMNPNYCSASPKSKKPFASGYSCDEYPFASTVEGKNAGGKTATRCVPVGQNQSQGGQISGLYKNQKGGGKLPDGTQFFVDIGNPGAPGAGYCMAYPGGGGSCNNPVGDKNSAGSQR